MPRAVCSKCQTEFRPEDIGVIVFEMSGERFEAKDYKIWHADLYKCPGCGVEVVIRFADRPLAEHFQDDFEKKKNAILKSGVRVIYDYERPGIEPAKEPAMKV